MKSKEELNREITRLRGELMQTYIDECRDKESEVNRNYDMGLVTFEERVLQLEEIFREYKKLLKPFDDLYLIH